MDQSRLCFVAAILVVRRLLSLAGYPLNGIDSLHITQVSCGGLLMAPGRLALPASVRNPVAGEIRSAITVSLEAGRTQS